MHDQNFNSRDLFIALTLLEFLTPAKLRILRDHYTSPENLAAARTSEIAALLRVPEERAKLVKNPLHLPEVSRIVTAVRDHAVTIADPEYPALLRQIPDPPPALFCEGNRELFGSPSIGIVGSRRASRYGLAVAERLASDLSSLGITVVSGLARGIDQAAHRGALDGKGSTVAILGTGIDVDYPRGSRSLREAIARSGLIATELPPGTPPRPSHFPVRNRIISGLSLGVVVVEATDRSGSLITARMAAEQNREVFAVPGSIFSKSSEGPHRLVQYGAKLVHDVDDILEELPQNLRPRGVPEVEMEEPEGLAGSIWAKLKIDEPTHVDALSSELGIDLGSLSTSLLELEMSGRIRAVPGGRWVRNPRR